MKMNDGNILRVSTTQYTVVTILISLLQPILIVFVVAIAVSFIMAQRISKSIIKPINALDLDNPSNNEPYDELAPLLRKSQSKSERLKSRLKNAEKKARRNSG